MGCSKKLPAVAMIQKIQSNYSVNACQRAISYPKKKMAKDYREMLAYLALSFKIRTYVFRSEIETLHDK